MSVQRYYRNCRSVHLMFGSHLVVPIGGITCPYVMGMLCATVRDSGSAPLQLTSNLEETNNPASNHASANPVLPWSKDTRVPPPKLKPSPAQPSWLVSTMRIAASC